MASLSLTEVVKSAGEGSRGGQIIGHTSSGKPIYNHDHQLYEKEHKKPGWTSSVTVAGHGNHEDVGKHILRRELPDWNKQDHHDAARTHEFHADEHREAHSKLKDSLEEKHHGKVRPSFERPNISGGVDPSYSDEDNNQLRNHSHAASRHERIAQAHRAAGSNLRVQKSGPSSISLDEVMKSGPVLGMHAPVERTGSGKPIYGINHPAYHSEAGFAQAHEGHSGLDHLHAASYHEKQGNAHLEDSRPHAKAANYGMQGKALHGASQHFAAAAQHYRAAHESGPVFARRAK